MKHKKLTPRQKFITKYTIIHEIEKKFEIFKVKYKNTIYQTNDYICIDSKYIYKNNKYDFYKIVDMDDCSFDLDYYPNDIYDEDDVCIDSINVGYNDLYLIKKFTKNRLLRWRIENNIGKDTF